MTRRERESERGSGGGNAEDQPDLQLEQVEGGRGQEMARV